VLHQLVDGRIALGITAKGLYLFSADGELLLSLTTSDYHRITAIANREPGVLWVASEDGLEKVLYSSALSVFGQKLGLTLGWPIIERWHGRLFVASDGKLYRAVAGPQGAPTHFELHPSQPESGAWALAAWGPHMLVAGPNRVYSVGADDSLRPVAEVSDLAHLVMINATQCYAIGRSEIALLEWRDGNWTERVARTRGVTYPSVVHRVRNSVWIEMGGQVGRLWHGEGKLTLDLIPNSTWTTRPWVNIGAVEGTVVLSAEPGERRFYDEDRGTWTEAPALHRLLERSPFWIARLEKDESGTIWGTHDDGVIRFKPSERDYEIDTRSFDLINDRYPMLQVLPGSDVWIIAGQSLYHVEQRWTTQPMRTPKPRLVSVVDAQGVELLTSRPLSSQKIRLPFQRNSLTFHFFAGSDAVRRAPTYEYKLTEQDHWTAMAGSQVSFRGLHEGKYNLQARLAEKFNPSAPVANFPFEIAAPWYRTVPAYLCLGLISVLGLVGVMRWSSYVERKRNRVLEKVVHERTHQLQETMAKLGEETRNAATLAERDRLANEIHDSVQQGLTGAILQLDTTLKSPAVSSELRPRLNVVRNMVSYARQEVQHAVWDMESPLLEGSELASALRNLTTFVDSGDTKIEVSVSGEPIPLGRTMNHNLLRIAQEATTNAIRHARAQGVMIHLAFEMETVALTISDDGIGFVPDAVLQDRVGHLGLRGIRNRVRKLRGQLVVESAPSQGTSIRILVPKSNDESSAGST
jgi:signal transduction histidine kinase